MKKINLTFGFIFFLQAIIAQTTFHKSYLNGSNFSGYKVFEKPDGYVICGTGYIGSIFGYSPFMLKTDLNGDTLWVRTYTGIDLWQTIAADQTSDGGYVIVGSTKNTGAGSEDIFLLKTDSAGNILWSKAYGGPDNDMGVSVQLTSDGGYMIAGTTDNFGGVPFKTILIKTNSSGSVQWSETIDGGYGNDYALNAIQTSDGNYAVFSKINFSSTLRYPTIIKIDTSGNLLWSKEYTGGNINFDYGCQTSDGGFIVTGSGTPGSWDYAACLKTDGSGNITWSRIYQFTVSDAGTSLKEIQGGYCVGGYYNAYPPAGSPKAFMMKIDTLGDPVWAKGYYHGNDYEAVHSIVPTVDDGFILTGSRNESAVLIKTDSYGSSGCHETAVNPILYYPSIAPANYTLYKTPVNPVVTPFSFNQSDTPGTVLTFCFLDNISEAGLNSLVKLFPNPSSGQVNISGLDSPSQLNVYDIFGRRLLSENLTGDQSHITISDFSRGTYFAEIISGKERLMRILIRE